MDVDRFTLALLVLRDDAPELSRADEDALQDAHMAHLSALHERGELLAAGPVMGKADRRLRGFSIFRCDEATAEMLADGDPGVHAGRYRTELHSWMVPAGLMTFTPGHLPASMAEAFG
jgi:uncharacterized protein YciI